MVIPISLILVGLAILIAGGEGLVRGASSLAKKWKVPTIVIGLTVVSFGTSAPELIVNVLSAMKGSVDLAIGNVVGSNIANILLILGVSAIIMPLKVKRGTTWKEIPLALLAVLLLYVMGNDILFDKAATNILTRTDALSFIAIFIIFLYYTFGISKSEGENEQIKEYSVLISISLLITGIVGLTLGGKLLVDNAIILAKLAGLSEALIGLTIVAVGTSLPELATSVIAVIHKQDDLAIGNVVGSNIFNILWILGVSALITPLPIAQALNYDIIINVVVTILLFAFMFIHDKHRLNRWQGILFVGIYAAYIFSVIFRG